MERQWSRRSASGYSTGLAQTAGVNGPRYTLTTLDGFGDSCGTRDRERRKPAGAIVRGYAIRDVRLLAAGEGEQGVGGVRSERGRGLGASVYVRRTGQDDAGFTARRERDGVRVFRQHDDGDAAFEQSVESGEPVEELRDGRAGEYDVGFRARSNAGLVRTETSFTNLGMEPDVFLRRLREFNGEWKLVTERECREQPDFHSELRRQWKSDSVACCGSERKRHPDL